jgi:AcrR family transcriptional regulator
VIEMTTRRTGEELTDAIYDAALTVLNQLGYEKTTFATIAKEAGTSRTVLYRRWDSPKDLLIDAVHTKGKVLGTSVRDGNYDTGSLRGDLFKLCNEYRLAFNRINRDFFHALLSEPDGSKTFQMFANNHVSNLYVVDRIFAKAQLRGEVTVAITDNVKLLPFKLMRYELIASAGPVPKSIIPQILDEIVLPAIMAQQNKKEPKTS